ncbi:hypothetical protein AUJ84_01130 [Candidatus Pacearchaeota archaeon CG1_02_32_132]|nr:MAG: hypothetical protein AUJ84_01130 [Candidatus Pacearchaeota archaeon CG1_02_32_132]
MKKKFLFFLPILILTLSIRVMAHCPLCTIGAGAVAVGAIWLGISKIIVALFIGAFAMSMGMWFSKIPKKRYIPFQKAIIIIVVFLSTIIPLMPIFSAIGPLYLPFIGSYGTTYAVNYSLASTLLGGLITFTSPGLNKKIKQKTNKRLPFQGLIVTFTLLLVSALIIQVILWK